MEQLFIFTGGGTAEPHYLDTIVRSVKLENFQNFLSSTDRDAIRKAHGGNPIKVWGAIPGENNTNFWEAMNLDDTVLVYHKKFITHAGRVSYKLRNKGLAKHFWGEDQGKTWELIYFLKDVSLVNIAINVFSEAIGYKSNWFPRGFQRINPSEVRVVVVQYGTIHSFLNSLRTPGTQPVEGQSERDRFLEKTRVFLREEQSAVRDEQSELEVEKKAENFFGEIPKVDRKERAVQIINSARDLSESDTPKAKAYTVKRYERGLVGRAMKELCDCKCMIKDCGYTFKKKDGEFYAEAHHLEALSDGGYDHPRNVVVLCANHHRQFHYADVKMVERTEKELTVTINNERKAIGFMKRKEE